MPTITTVRMSAISGVASPRVTVVRRWSGVETARAKVIRRSGPHSSRRVAKALAKPSGRLAERGFNQSALLAESLARAMQIDFATHGLLKIRDTLPQAGLNRAARLKNVRGAFDCARSLAGRHVALVDDVMTTGATLSEAAKALKKAGAASVSAWVLARAGREWAMPPAQNDPDLPDIAIPF